MDSLESKGKSVDEAIYNGLNKMGLGIDEVDIEILHEGSKGLFGLGKSAVVRLSLKKEESAKIIQAEEKSAPEIAEVPEPRKPDKPKAPPGEPEQFLIGLFQKMHVEATCAMVEDENNIIKIEITGKDTAVLIGRRGDTLDALQYLTGLVINRDKEEYKKVMLDAENYRHKREVALEKLARRLANNVTKSGKPVTLEPMNPYERRILHATLQQNPRVETYSEGEEPYRRVVIKRKRRDKREHREKN